MIQVLDQDVIMQTETVLSAMKKSKVGLISGDGFQRKAFPVLEERYNRQYPYEVRLPKSIDVMVNKADVHRFEPARVITINEPIEGPYSHMWFGDATSGAKLLCGYINGDSRYIFDTELGDKNVHGILVGSTGQGKSVTLNAIIYNMCTLYAPWEVHITLSDAKIVEFKSIAENNPMPQIDIVAATGDVDYLLSVLRFKHEEMLKVNTVFSGAENLFNKPVKKLEDFRKVTGLMLPQNILIFDEFQAMFQKAGKLRQKIIDELDAIIRLGRNTGYHLLLTSQELGNDIPGTMMSNITFRGAMGCYPAVSEAILNNDKASLNLGKKGHMIVNLNSAQKPSEEFNINVRVPFIDPQTKTIAKSSIKAGHDFGVTPILQFYDEFSVEYVPMFKKALNELPCNPNIIYLGEPSCINQEIDKRLKINLDTKEPNKNICVVAPIQSDLMRHFVMLKENTLRHKKEITNIVMCLNSVYTDDYDAEELTDKLFFRDRDFKGSQTIAIARSLIYRRMLCLRTDSFVFNPEFTNVDLENSDKLFYQIVQKGSDLDSHTNRLRFYYMKNLLVSEADIAGGFGEMSDEERMSVLESTLNTYSVYGAKNSCLTQSMIPDLQVWLLGLDRLLGIGIDPKSSNMNALKKLMNDSANANVRFTIFVSTLEELGDINNNIHWYIMDNPITRDLNKAKIQDDYPEQVGSSLAVLVDKFNNAQPCAKFKKLFFDGEIPLG